MQKMIFASKGKNYLGKTQFRRSFFAVIPGNRMSKSRSGRYRKAEMRADPRSDADVVVRLARLVGRRTAVVLKIVGAFQFVVVVIFFVLFRRIVIDLHIDLD